MYSCQVNFIGEILVVKQIRENLRGHINILGTEKRNFKCQATSKKYTVYNWLVFVLR